jgi:hypothetical protein
MTTNPAIFIGVELTADVEGVLGDCREQDRIYIEDPAYLERMSIDGKNFIGKRLASGASPDRLEDTARNVVSLLTRVGQKRFVSSADVLLLPVTPVESVDQDVDQQNDNGFDYSNLLK